MIVGAGMTRMIREGCSGQLYQLEKSSPQTAAMLVVRPWVYGGFAFGDGDRVGNVSFGGPALLRLTDYVLVYKTGPLEHDVTVSGLFTADLKVSTSGTDSDFDVKLIDVFPAKYPDYDADPSAPAPDYGTDSELMVSVDRSESAEVPRHPKRAVSY